MKRRDFIKWGSLFTVGTTIFNPISLNAKNNKSKQAKNIIFLVSDGMSMGTLQMADTLKKQMYGKSSSWISLYEKGLAKRSLMNTSAANSLVTDSAAGGSAWGCGHKVNNNVLNVLPNGDKPTPILQKFKRLGKSVGCVTTVPITHATPASFCVNNISRHNQPEIASQYLGLRFDVMMGGGAHYFSADAQESKEDLIPKYKQAGFDVVSSTSEMKAASGSKPMLGLFSKFPMAFEIDRLNTADQTKTIPSIAEMTTKAIDILSKNKNGFALQIEGGRVDWAAHDNDGAGLLFDQMAFDDAIEVALKFAIDDKNTLVIITTDHGNANPGLVYGDNITKRFEAMQKSKHSNDWFFNQLKKNSSAAQIRSLIEVAGGYGITMEEANLLLKHYENQPEDKLKPPYALMGKIQSNYTGISWLSLEHTADYVELTALGPGAENLPGFVDNTFLHNFMLESAGVQVK